MNAARHEFEGRERTIFWLHQKSTHSLRAKAVEAATVVSHFLAAERKNAADLQLAFAIAAASSLSHQQLRIRSASETSALSP